jgi:hypothetical protein
MRKILLILSILCCASACKVDKKHTDAIKVATDFLTAYENCDFGKVCEFALPSAKKNIAIEQLLHDEKAIELRKENDLIITLKDGSIISNALTDTVWATFVINGHIEKAFFSNGTPHVSENPIEKQIIIIKINNKWFADFIY